MGNSGSTHNINWDSSAGGAFTTGRSKSELSGYYQRGRHNHAQLQDNETQTQTLLRRQNNQNIQKIERIKSLPLGPALEQFKVLPKIAPENERLKLRPTTNGMLLHSGGTISGRNKDEMRVPGLMQRSRTLIFDQRENNEDFKENLDIAMPTFQRSQTLLHMTYKERDITTQGTPKMLTNKNVNKKEQQTSNRSAGAQNLRHARSEPDFRNDLNKPTHARQNGGLDSTNVPTTTVSSKQAKLNKYNKKRKAPAAPVKAPAAEKIGTKENNIEKEEKSQVTRRFRSNVNVKQSIQQTPPPLKSQQPQCMQPILPKAPIYRREKSCDAILLRSKTEAQENPKEKRYSFGSKTPIKIPITPAASQSNINTPSLPKQITKIPQLKRTFYFGMQSAENENTQTPNESTRSQVPSSKPNEKLKDSSDHTLERAKEKKLNTDQTVLAKPAIVIADEVKDEQINTLKYKLHRDTEIRTGTAAVAETLDDEDESQINDNGILVHIRPTLPRRQLEVPSFSPAAAWRMLLNAEEERQKQIVQRTTSNTLYCESPIQLRSNKLTTEDEELRQKTVPKTAKTLRRDQLNTMAWTPQQDLEDDEDDDAKIAEDNETSSSDDFDGDKDEEDGLLFFNGHSKKGRKESSTLKGNEKNSSIGIHLFSLSLPRDAHLDSHMQKKNSVNSNNNEKTTSFSSLQKLKLTISGGSGNKCTCRASITKFVTSNSEFAAETDICEIHNNQSMYRSDNWVLHKTGTKDGASNIMTSNSRNLLKEDITPTVEPTSLSFLTAGKHVMYLPGMTAPNKDYEGTVNNDVVMRKEGTPTREATKSAPRQRQRKRETRESLQDETPVLRQHKTQAQPANNPTQRFSFQSTVRLLEKRRLAEKLSRDAEIREAQRKSELEAMKRVEEDFQRKRANEKANIRHQLRLYCSGSGIETTHDQYNSLPAYASRQQQQQLNDTNNNKIAGRRTEPEGAAASPSPSNLVVDMDSYRFGHQISHLPLKRMDSDCGDSDIDVRNADIQTHFNRTASLVEPYLQSFMK